MPDSNAAPPNRKRSFDFDDIMSLLGEDRPKTPAKAPEQEPAAVQPGPEEKIVAPEPPAGQQPVLRIIKTESAIVEPPKPAAVEAPAAPVAQPAAAPPDNAIVDRLLADFAEKNAEILRLNNELTQIKFEVREKEQKISALTSIEAVLDRKEETIRGKDAVIQDKEDSIKDKEATIKDKEAALKEKDALLKEKEALLKDIEGALAAKDNEIRAYEVKVMELETRMSEMAEQLGTLRKLTARESTHEPFVEPAAPVERQAINVQEQMTSGEDDVASIFRRLAEAKVEEPEGEGEGKEQPRRPRSAKLYDL